MQRRNRPNRLSKRPVCVHDRQHEQGLRLQIIDDAGIFKIQLIGSDGREIKTTVGNVAFNISKAVQLGKEMVAAELLRRKVDA